MYTNKSIRLTAKCQGILLLIQRVNNNLENLKAKHKLLNDEGRSPLFFGKKRIGYVIEDKQEILDRLTRYYTNTLSELMEEASKQFLQAAA